MINRYFKVIFIFLILISSISLLAQDKFKNEEAMVKEADELFRNEEYVKAYEYYQTLLSRLIVFSALLKAASVAPFFAITFFTIFAISTRSG